MKATIFFLVLTLNALAGVEVYTGTSGEILYIEAAPQLGKEVYLVKMTGINSAWKDRVIKTEQSQGKYVFGYEMSKNSPRKSYSLVSEVQKTMVSGSIVKQVRLWIKEQSKDGVLLSWDKEMTSKSQHIQLLDEHKKAPFFPEVD